MSAKYHQFEKTFEEQKNRRSHNRKRKIEKETGERERYNSSKEKRKQILGEAMNSGSHKKDECANENTMDVPKTRKVQMKPNRCQAFANAFKKSTSTELS